MVARGNGGRKGKIENLGWIYTHCYILNGQPTRTYFTAQGTLLSVMWQPGWRRVWERMDMCVCMAEFLHCSPETISSVQFSHSVMSKSLQPHGLQHTSPPCPSPTPRVYSCPLSRWYHPTISSSVIPFSSHLQSFPASGSFQMSQHFASGSQRIGASALASVLPINIQGWFPLVWTGWISLQSKGLLRVFSNTTVQKHQFFGAQLLL